VLHGHLIALALAAAAPWSEPVSVGAPEFGSGDPAIAFARDGTSVLSTNAVARPNGVSTGRLVIRAPDGTVTATRLPGQLAAEPVVYGRGRLALLYMRGSVGPRGRTRLSVSFGTTAAPVSGLRPHVLATFAPAQAELGGGPAIAVSGQGEVAVAWTEFLQRGRIQGLGIHRLRLAVRPPGRAFGRPRTLATASGVIQDAALAYGRTGDLLVAYGTERVRERTRRTVQARLRRAHRAFGPAQVLGPHEGLLDLSAAMARSGRAAVAWGTQDGGEEAGVPYRIRAATRAPGSATFGRVQLLDSGGGVVERPYGALALGLGPDGSATVAWSNIANGSNPVRVSIAGPSTRFRPAGQVAPNGAVADVAVRSDGAALMLWTAFTEEPDADNQIQAAVRPPGALAFGSTENVSALEPRQLSLGRAAFDPVTGRAAVVWSRLAEPGPEAPVWFSSRAP
jgi:hypothetical protein